MTRALPSSLEAERAILGAVLLDNIAYAQAAEYLQADDFSLDSHRRVYGAMTTLAESSKSIDLITLTDELGQQNAIQAVGGAAYLAGLTDGLPQRPNIEHYVRIVKDKALLRGLIHSANAIVAQAEDESVPAGDVLAEAEAKLFALSERSVRRGFDSMRDVFVKHFGTLDKFYSAEAKSGLTTGFGDLDFHLGGLRAQDLIILAARPSMGKTALAMNIAERIAVGDDKVVGVFSMEMSKEGLLERVACSMAKVPSNDLRSGFIGKEAKARVDQALARLFEAHLYVDDTPALKIGEMRAKARRLKHQHKRLDLIVVDYLQLMASSGKVENRTQEVTQFSRGLKNLAKDLECPVLALSQLSRKCEDRTDKRPQLADLRESGAIEQDADLVMFIYRAEVYDSSPELKGKAELIIAKQRNGPTGVIPLAWLASSTRFENAAREA